MKGIYPQTLENLTHSLGQLPGIGARSSERMALALLDWNKEDLSELSQLLATLKDKVKYCVTCGNLTEEEKCAICLDQSRDPTLICVVENVAQIPVIQKCGKFNGGYHVLGGRISPLNDITIEDLNVQTLFDRIHKNAVSEIIISTSPDVEGEATANFLANEINENFDIKISRIALGVPLGSDLTYADSATMGMAINSRRSMI
jgi:recombination protein RecR